MTKKILHIINHADYNGASLVCYRTAKFVSSGHHYLFSVGNNRNNIQLEDFYKVYKSVNGSSVFSKLISIINLIKVLKQNQFDIVHYHDGGILFLLISYFVLPSKIIHHVHSGNVLGNNSSRISIAKKKILVYLKNRTILIFTSKNSKEFYLSKIGEPLKNRTIYNPVPHTYRIKTVKNNNYIGYLGRINFDKNIILVKSILNDKFFDNFSLVMKGQLESKKVLESFDFKNFIFEYPNFDLESFFNKIKVLLFPSLLYESLPNVIVEAITFDTPVIAYRIPAVEEILGNEYPLIVDEFSSEAFINKLKLFMSGYYNMSELSVLHKKISMKFDNNIFIKSIEDIYGF